MRKKRGKIKDKRGLELEELAKLLIAFFLLVLVFIGLMVLFGKSEAMIEIVKKIFRFGR